LGTDLLALKGVPLRRPFAALRVFGTGALERARQRWGSTAIAPIPATVSGDRRSTSTPDAIDGCPVIASSKITSVTRVVIADRGDCYVERYVCAFHEVGAPEWYLGKLYASLDAANATFTNRVQQHTTHIIV
jgi:hypothetical protein